ncbi:MAG: guanylate kinase [Clostridia bacterium]|nr:guanylate kinase [Clostridia bacterium]
MKNKGLLVVISGPAGAGKGTVVTELVKDGNVEVSISATTRAPRGQEKDGVEYHFLSREQFQDMIENDGFLEYAQYCGNYYGSPKKQAEEWMHQGKDVILEIEVQGCEKIKQQSPDCISIFIMPPSMEILEHRLRKRATDSEESILHRLARAKEEIRLAENYDYIIVNGPIEECVADVKSVLNAEKLKANRFDVKEILG